MIYIQLLESMSLIALSAYIYSQTRVFNNLIKNELKFFDKIMLVMFFSIIGIIGNYTGVNVQPHDVYNIKHSVETVGYIGIHDAIANTRPIAVITAGFIGGPIIGTCVGIIAGINRYCLGGFTAFSCAISTIIEGLIGAAAKKCSKDSEFNIKYIFIGSIIAEIVQMIIILIFARPFDVAIRLVQLIALPMILINSFGTVIFVNIIKNAREEYNKIGAIQAQKALSIAKKTISYMRKGLNIETSKNVVHIIYEMSDISGAFIGDKNGMLAYDGIKLDEEKLNEKLKKYYLSPNYTIVDIFDNNKKLFFICCPFNICNSGFEGVLGLGVKSEKDITVYFREFAEELSELLSNQIELYKLNKLAQEASIAKFKALRAQIEPHFLFNALNTIASFCRTNPLKARELIIDLSNYFRQTLKRQDDFIFLKDEIDFIKSYLSIEKARFGERLKLVIDISCDLMNNKIPSFVLQPIIENAIQHGILPKPEGGRVLLKAILYGDSRDKILFSIEDNGVGMDSIELDNLIKNWPGIGLRNVNERLKLLYGEDYGINIKASLDNGTKVSFIIPVKERYILNE